MTLLSPTIIEQIVEGRQPAKLRLDALLEGFPVKWEKQALLLSDRDA